MKNVSPNDCNHVKSRQPGHRSHERLNCHEVESVRRADKQTGRQTCRQKDRPKTSRLSLKCFPWSSQNMPTPICASPKQRRTNQICKATHLSLDKNTKLPKRLQENFNSLKEPAWKAGKSTWTNKKIFQKSAYASPTDTSKQSLKSPKIGFATLRQSQGSAQLARRARGPRKMVRGSTLEGPPSDPKMVSLASLSLHKTVYLHKDKQTSQRRTRGRHFGCPKGRP